ncbi:MAG: iron uptake system protein EfeO [Acidihalobacter sp.]|uniref:iron uptake system protein EfeO n=1 Tax=Acidihalobacter sp. TaxID=1872108 RepID=UPI00307E48C4
MDNAVRPDNHGPNPRIMRWILAGSGALAALALGAFYAAAQFAQQHPTAGEITVTIHPATCDPDTLTVPAGRTGFRIVNHSGRAVEWEILDGVMVVAERENITPGMSQVVSVHLEPGDYAITCGLLSNPRGTLHVTRTAESDAAAKTAPALKAFIGPLSEQRFDLIQHTDTLKAAVAALLQAIAAGDLRAARSAYLTARIGYQRIAATAQRFGELDNRINARADYYAAREQDPGFGGFHRIEYGLFAQRSTAGLVPVAQQLQSDVDSLETAMLAHRQPPRELAADAARLLQSLADNRATGEEERYSHLDLYGFAANLRGAEKTIDMLAPLLSKRDPSLLEQLKNGQATLQATLQSLREDDAYRSYDQADAATRKRIAAQAQALANALNAVNPALGLGDS